MKLSRNKILAISVTGIMAALSIVILALFPEVVIVPAFPHLKIEFSNIPPLIATFICGPLAGIMVVLLKSGFQLFVTTSPSFGIGEFINFVMGSTLVLVMYYGSRLFSGKKPIVSPKGYYIACAITIVMSIIMGWLLNMALLPLFFKVMNWPLTREAWIAAILGTTPLNVLKSAATTIPVYPAIRVIQKLIQPRSRSNNTDKTSVI